MKGKINAKKTKRRPRSYNCGICNHHISRGRFRWFAVEHFALCRSQANAVGSDSVSNQCATSGLAGDKGSITAEFALVIPAVLLVFLLSVSVMSLQSKRVAAVELAATSSRALARGESEAVLNQIFAETNLKLTREINYRELSVCVCVSWQSELFWLGMMHLSEEQCARKSGL